MALTQTHAACTQRTTKKIEKLKNFMDPKDERFDVDSFESARLEDIWIFDKLIVAKRAGHTCGPMGSMVPGPGPYIVRPVINTYGMGQMARIQNIQKFADDMHPAEFWCEIFSGRHLSVDYEYGKQVLAVIGTKHPERPLQRFVKWEKTEEKMYPQKFILDVIKNYPLANCEFIGDKIIEVHMRGNPDFMWGNSKMLPLWDDDEEVPEEAKSMRFMKDPPNYPSGRIGYFID
jgi:hypothetical protein